MIADSQQSAGLLLVDCPTCQRRGVVGTPATTCPMCRGSGGYAYLDGYWLKWGRTISRFDAAADRLVHGLQVTMHGLILLAAVALLGWGIVQHGLRLRNTPTWTALTNVEGQSALVLGIGLLLSLYLYYRLTEASRHVQRLPAYQGVWIGPAPHVSYAEIERIVPEKRLDVAPMLDDQALTMIDRAKARATALGHAWVEPMHLLAEVLDEPTVQQVFGRLGTDRQALASMVARRLRQPAGPRQAEAFLSAAFRQMLFQAVAEAYWRQARQVDTTDLLVAIETVEPDAGDMLYELNITAEKLRNVVAWVHHDRRLSKAWRRYRRQARHKPKGVMNRAMTAVATPFLDRFSADLTQLARTGSLPLCVGREQELEEIFRLMSSGQTSVCLVGLPGVGKQTIIAGLAERMAIEAVPGFLQDKRLVQLAIPSLVAGASGDLEGRLVRVLNEVARAGNIVLVLEDIHHLVGVSQAGGEGLDLSEILASALGSVIPVIATTTPLDYRQAIERQAIGDRLAKVEINELTPQQTIVVLTTKVGRYEASQQVFFAYDALESIVSLAQRYMPDRFFPEKALRLLDEVAAYVARTRGRKSLVTPEDVAVVVSAKKNIPLTTMTESDKDKLLHLEERLHQRIVGQDQAVTKVAAALRRARTDVRDTKRPIAAFLFLGPTGVGKTELAKTIADVYFGSEGNMIRLDMSEYQEASSIRQLIGAPVGSGGSSGGLLTEAVRRQPFSIVLLDELEKAHPDILNVFLQVFDDGRLTDTAGQTIDFTNTIIIATSNAGTDVIQARLRENVPMAAIEEELLRQVLNHIYRPELLNRFDGVIVFAPLTPNDVVAITGLLLAQVARRLETKGIQFKATPAAIAELAKDGFRPEYGARPLRRLIQERVDNALAVHLLQGKLSRRDVAVLEPDGVIRVERAPEL